MILRIKNIDGWLLYKKDCIPLIDKGLTKGGSFVEPLESRILRIEDFLIRVPERIAIYIVIENDEVIGLMILIISNDFNEYTGDFIKICGIYTYYIKTGYIWKLAKYSHLVVDYAKSMNCNRVLCSSIIDWEKFAKRLFKPYLKLEYQYKVFEIEV